MKKIRISVITPYYNTDQFIVECIESITKQKIDNDKFEIEHILVNDCSTDDSKEIINAYLKINNNQNIIYQNIDTPTNLGCGGARKYGIDHATGEYLMFLDSDDYYINDDFIQRAINIILEENADIVEYGIEYLNFFKDGPKQWHVDKKYIIENNSELALMDLFQFNIIKFHAWTKIINKKLADKFPYSTRRQWEDVDTIPVWVSLANKIVVMPTTEIAYRTPENSIIMKDPMSTRLGTIEAISKHFERFKDNIKVLKSMYIRAMIDLKFSLNNKTSNDPMFNELSKLNTYMLSYLMPNKYKQLTYNIQ